MTPPDAPTPPEHATAMVWTGGTDPSEAFVLDRIPIDLAADDALVGIDLATVCGSDRHTVSGRRSSPCPSVLGHEAVGQLLVVPPGRRAVDGTALQVGDRVIWSVIDSCPDAGCARCRAGYSAKCHRLRKVGHEPTDLGWPLSGGYASHQVLPPGVAIVRVPDQVADGPAATAACALATVMACLEAGTGQWPSGLAGQRVLIFGAGMLGLYAAAVAASAGATSIRVIDPAPVRRELATRFGATATGDPDDGVDDRVDLVLELSGAPSSVARGLASLDIGGTLVLAGSVTPTEPVPVNPEAVVRGWLTIRGVHNYEPRHLARAVAFLADTTWPWQQVIAEPADLARLPELISAEAPDGILRMSVRPRPTPGR